MGRDTQGNVEGQLEHMVIEAAMGFGDMPVYLGARTHISHDGGLRALFCCRLSGFLILVHLSLSLYAVSLQLLSRASASSQENSMSSLEAKRGGVHAHV
jgi:hypothetical protein